MSSPAEVARVAAAVDPLVVAEHDLRDVPVAVHAAHDVRAPLRVRADQLPVLLRQAHAGQRVVGEGELADVVQQPGRVDELLVARREPGGGGGRLREARDGGRVARGHPVAHAERLDHHADHAVVQRLQLVHLRAQLVALALGVHDRAEQVAVGHQDHGEHRHGEQPDLLVGEHGAGGQRAGRDLPRHDRQVEPPHREQQARPVAQAEVADDQQEVQEVRDQVDAEDDRRGRELGGLLRRPGPRAP